MKEDEYRTIDYSGRWYAEKLRSPGVWKVLGVYATKEEAEKAINQSKEVKNGDFQKEKTRSEVL